MNAVAGQTRARPCRICGKQLRQARPTDICLTCEFYERRRLRALVPGDAKNDENEQTRETTQVFAGPFATESEPAGESTAAGHQGAPGPDALGATDPAWAAGPPRDGSPRQEVEGATEPLRAGTIAATLPVVELPYAPEEVISTLDGYDLLEELGRGGMGLVYRAFSRRLGRFVALKVIRSGESATDIEVARFVNEAMLAARLSHPNIVTIYDSGQSKGLSYFVMELVEGRTLGWYLEKGLRAPEPGSTATFAGLFAGRGTARTSALESAQERPTLREVVRILRQVAFAVHYAHERGVVHRDLKPDNILLDAALEPQVTDFGIAKAVQQEESRLTVAGNVMGSPQYMSPEQANGELGAIGPRSDVYSLGAVLYHALTGGPLFEEKSPVAILAKVLREEPRRPQVAARERGRPEVPLDLETICLKALEKEAPRRYPSARELGEELGRYLEGEPIHARPVGTLERWRKKLRRNRPMLVSVFVAATLLLTLSAAFSVSLVDNIQRTSTSLESLDRKQALAQAHTLERAIRVNMLQGRADLARELVRKLGEDPAVGSIRVARIDKTPAYTDFKTRRRVEQRLSRPEVLAWIKREHADFLDEVADLRRRAFPSIDRSRELDTRPVDVDDVSWRRALATQRPVTYVEDRAPERRLVVLKPIENSKPCQVCHGRPDDYVGNETRAVLVVKRSLAPVERMIASNQESTALIGSVTVFVLLFLAAIYARVFGIGLGRRRFGGRED